VPLREVQADPHRGVICDRCGVEVTLSKVRRERMGHIDSRCPWRTSGSSRRCRRRWANLLDMTLRDLERVIYYNELRGDRPGEQEVQERELLDETASWSCAT